MASKVNEWVACDLRYVGENKLARLHDEELVALHRLLAKKHAMLVEPLVGTRDARIGAILALKQRLPRPDTLAPTSAPAPEPRGPHEACASEAEAEAEAEAAPPRTMTVEEKLTEAAKAFDAMMADEAQAPLPAAPAGEPAAVDPTPPEALSGEQQQAKEDRDARLSAFVQLAAAARPPSPKKGGGNDAQAKGADPVTVDSHHRLRICSFNACKMRLGSANKAYTEAGDDGTADEYDGTQKGAELAQKWLTLAARMADFDVILLQEVPGTEKVMNQKIETFANMLDIATEEGREWSAINSQKSGKDGKVVGPGAEVHVCFLKSPVRFKQWNTLRKVGATELDYAPLQVLLHDPRFADPADRDFVVTSVHLPPSKRTDARDNQVAALLRNYSAPDTSEYRMQQPFKPSRGVRGPPTHIIAGDFNTYPGNEQYNLPGSGFLSKIPKNAATTSGHQHYDNVLVDEHANDRFLIGGGIMQLKDMHNAAKGEVGLSDHHPVFAEVREVQKTGKPLPAATSERVEGGSPLPLKPVPEEVAVKAAPPQSRNCDDAGSAGSMTSDSDLLTDDGGLPRLVHDEPEEEESATEVEERPAKPAKPEKPKGEEEEAAPEAAPAVPEVPEEPPPPLAEGPMAIWDGLSEEAKPSNPNYNLDQPKPEFTDDSEEDPEALTDDGLALDLPRVVHYEPAEEAAVREVVSAAMERVAELVVATAVAAAPAPAPALTAAEAPSAAAASTEAPPVTPSSPPEPAPEPAPASPEAAPEAAPEEANVDTALRDASSTSEPREGEGVGAALQPTGDDPEAPKASRERHGNCGTAGPCSDQEPRAGTDAQPQDLPWWTSGPEAAPEPPIVIEPESPIAADSDAVVGTAALESPANEAEEETKPEPEPEPTVDATQKTATEAVARIVKGGLDPSATLHGAPPEAAPATEVLPSPPPPPPPPASDTPPTTEALEGEEAARCTAWGTALAPPLPPPGSQLEWPPAAELATRASGAESELGEPAEASLRALD